MGIVRKFLGPRSKYDKSLPYTYEARVDVLSGRGTEPVYDHYFSDTICGLIEYLKDNDIKPSDVQLFGVYQKKEIPLKTTYCTTPDGAWLHRPDICKSLEDHYRNSLEERYKGHIDDGACSFEDRDRKGMGPY